MQEHQWLARKFEENRGRLRAVAYRMLGSASDADDAIQEAWLKLNRSGTESIENIAGWLTTVVARVCLDMLRSRASRREEPLDTRVFEPAAPVALGSDPEQEALLADSVGLAVLVVLERLTPSERIAFVMHDMFAVPFEEIAPVVGRSPEAARQLASRARRRVRGAVIREGSHLARQREVVDSFLTALRGGDFDGLLGILDPDILVRIDSFAAAPEGPREIRGARNWARGALAFSHAARFVRPVLVDGRVGLILAPRGHLLRVLRFTFAGGKISGADVIADPARLRELDLALVE